MQDTVQPVTPLQREQIRPARWRRFAERQLPSVVLSLLIVALILSILYPAVVYTVPSGQVAVLWRRFPVCGTGEDGKRYCVGGTDLSQDEVMYEGIHFIPP